jgi:hypothetical protein
MARNNFALTTTVAVALTAATEKTVVQLVAATNSLVAVTGADVTFDSTSNSAVPVVVKLIKTSTAGTGTGRNPLKTKDTSTTLTSTGTENHTVEGANANIMRIFHVHPQAGVIYSIPMRDEIELASTERLALKVTAPAGVNALGTIHGEE